MKKAEFKIKLEPGINLDVQHWAEREGRSKTRHIEVLMRRLVELSEKNPTALVSLGLLDGGSQFAAGAR